MMRADWLLMKVNKIGQILKYRGLEFISKILQKKQECTYSWIHEINTKSQIFCLFYVVPG